MHPKIIKLLDRIKNCIDTGFTGRVRLEINLSEGNITKIYFLPKEEIK